MFWIEEHGAIGFHKLFNGNQEIASIRFHRKQDAEPFKEFLQPKKEKSRTYHYDDGKVKIEGVISEQPFDDNNTLVKTADGKEWIVWNCWNAIEKELS